MINYSTRKLSLVSLICVFALCISLFCVITLYADGVAQAVETTTWVSLTVADSDDENGKVKEILPGGEFTVTTTIHTTRADQWASVSLYEGPLNDDNQTMNSDICQYLSYDNSANNAWYADTSNPFRTYANSTIDKFASLTEPKGIALQFSYQVIKVSTETDFVYSAKIKFSDNYSGDPLEFKFGIQPILMNTVGYGTGTTKDSASENMENISGLIESDYVTIKVRMPSSDATLDELIVGHSGSDLKIFSSADDAENPLLTATADTTGLMSYVSNNKELDNFVVTATAKDKYSGIEVSLKSFADTDIAETDIHSVESGDSVTLTLTPPVKDPDNEEDIPYVSVYLRVTSEDGQNTEIYEVKVTIAYVRLSALTATVIRSAFDSTDTTITDVTKTGLKDTFNPDTEESIIVYVPSDYDTDDGIEITPDILDGYGADTNIALSPNNCKVGSDLTSIISGGKFVIYDFKDELDDGEVYSVKLTLTASNGTTRDYVIEFEIVSVETTLTLKAIGADTSTELTNNEASATSESVDFYYFVTTEASGKAKFVITVPDGATVTVNDVEFVNTTEYEEGTVTIVITAEAGNTKSYKVMLAKQMFLKLAADSKYQFLIEEEQVSGSLTYYYRKAYGSLTNESGKTWEHGIDDTDVERVVLGQVKELTTVNAFLANIDSTQLNFIKLYSAAGTLIYDCGNAPDGINASDWDNIYSYVIATGWCIKYGVNEESADTVYISVLGDVDKSGTIGSNDAALLVSYLADQHSFTTAEERLAAYIGNNSGIISSNDAALIISIIMETEDIESFFYNPVS